MNSKKVFYGMTGLVVMLSLTAISLVFVGNNILKDSSTELNELKLEDRVLQDQKTALIKAQQDVEKYEDFEQIAKSIVPQDKDQAKAVREIIEIAKESGISIQSIGFPSSSLGSAESAPSPTPNDSTADDSAPAAPKAPAITQAEPVSGVPGVFALEMNIIPTGGDGGTISYDRFLSFLERLERNRRTAQVKQIKITPISGDSTTPFIDFSLTIEVFVKP